MLGRSLHGARPVGVHRPQGSPDLFWTLSASLPNFFLFLIYLLKGCTTWLSLESSLSIVLLLSTQRSYFAFIFSRG